MTIDTVQEFLNSQAGLLILGTIAAIIYGFIKEKKPAWAKVVDKYRPTIISAIKQAEKVLNEDFMAKNPKIKNKSIARLNLAMKVVLSIEKHLDARALQEAICAVHAEMERDGNLS